MVAVTEERMRSAAVLRQLKAYRDVSDGDLALAIGMSRSGIAGYMSAKTALDVDRMHGFARALDVEPVVFLMSPDEALRWTLEHRPNGERLKSRSRSFSVVDFAAAS
jgi:transcriptional regulator with XRE-family HTH domain